MKYIYAITLMTAIAISGCAATSIGPLPERKALDEKFQVMIIKNAASGRYPMGMATGKLSRNKKPDLMVTTWGDISGVMGIGEGRVSVLFGEDDKGRLLSTKDEYSVGFGASGIVTADLNKDGYLDLVVVSTNGITGTGQGYELPGQIWIYYGKENRTFPKRSIEQSPVAFPELVAVGDINNDGYLDIVLGSRVTKVLGILLGGPDKTSRQINRILLPCMIQSLTLGRFSDSGNLDIALLDQSEQRLIILSGDGLGAFKQKELSLNAYQNEIFEGIASGDLNNDQIDDIVVLSHERMLLFMGREGQLQAAKESHRGNFIAGNIHIADFDKDGKNDILVPVAPFGISIFFGVGDGIFSDKKYLRLPIASVVVTGNDEANRSDGPLKSLVDPDAPTGSWTNRIVSAVMDFDGNGFPDIAVAIRTSLLGRDNLMYPESISLLLFKNGFH